VTVFFCDPRHGIERELLLALQPDAGAFGEAEYIFCFDLAQELVAVLRNGGETCCREKQRGDNKCPRVAKESHCCVLIRRVQGPAIRTARDAQ
jgi:hypothetical protein